MPQKIDILRELKKDELLELGRSLNIRILSSWPKDRIVTVLDACSNVTKEIAEDVLKKRGGEKSIEEIIRERRSNFYENTAVEAFGFCEDIQDELAYGFFLGHIADSDYIKRTKAAVGKFDKLNVFKFERFPRSANLTIKQKKAIGKSKKAAWRFRLVSEGILNQIETDPNFAEFEKLRTSTKIPDRVKYYLIQVKKCYFVESFDATVIMCARAIEYALKQFFDTRVPPIRYGKKDTLGSLIRIYRDELGQDKLLEKILEVHNMDRIVCAHDIPPYDKTMGIEEADHAWTATVIILKDLLNVELK
jgi:hypothetical protein